MKIVIDTREQLPLKFNHPLINGITNYCLDVGDYGALFSDIDSCPFVFERKSINDLFGTLSQGYERFKKEIERAKSLNITLIIIVECSLTRIGFGIEHSKRTPQSIIQQIFTIENRYGVRTVFCNNRDEMAEYISHFFIARFKEFQEKKA